MAKSLKLFTYCGDSYLGMIDDTTGAQISVDSPVKVTFTYENASDSSAKLTWLLTPIMPNVLIKQQTGATVKNTMAFNSNLITLSTTLTKAAFFDDDLVNAYKSLTNETEQTQTPSV